MERAGQRTHESDDACRPENRAAGSHRPFGKLAASAAFLIGSPQECERVAIERR